MTLALLAVRAAWADVTVSPSRLVLDDEVRAAKVSVYNGGHHSLRIHASWSAIRQGQDGTLYPVPQGPPDRVRQALHLWPRDLVLKPGETAPVYVLLDPATPKDAHMRAQLRLDAQRQNDTGPRWGLSMPVFVRKAQSKVTAQITGVAQNDPRNLMVSLYRRGGATPYGALVVEGPDGAPIGVLNNVTLYANDRAVQFAVPLHAPLQAAAKVSYRGAGEFAHQVFDEYRIRVRTPSLERGQ